MVLDVVMVGLGTPVLEEVVCGWKTKKRIYVSKVRLEGLFYF